MSKKILLNKYFSKYLPKDLPWHERDGLVTYIEQLKYERFKENKDKHFQNIKIINFDLVNHRCRDDPLQNVEKNTTKRLQKQTLNIILIKKKTYSECC